MSREREMLKKVLAFLETDVENDFGFGSDIKVLLAQLEHIADVGNMVVQEPVAWMSINNNGGISIDNYYANHKDYVPLYTAPPKREPLNIEEIHNGLDGNNGYDDRFVDGVRFAEKAHGIGGGE